jgi:HAD superfamily hydrolase (TIGR01450 family)
VLSAPDALREFAGQRLVDVAEVDDLADGVAAVVIGDAGDDLPFGHLDVAFRAVRRGAELVAMHRNPWWQTQRGETLDSGAIVAGLEYATGRRAMVCGKPSQVVFRQAVRALGDDLGLRRLPASSVAMVGDDLVADIRAARRAGLRGILVLTGKHGPGEVASLSGRRSGTRPDAIAPSLAGLVGALD